MCELHPVSNLGTLSLLPCPQSKKGSTVHWEFSEQSLNLGIFSFLKYIYNPAILWCVTKLHTQRELLELEG